MEDNIDDLLEENSKEKTSPNKFFKDKKNLVIIVLSILLLINIWYSFKRTTDTSNNLAETLVIKEEQLQEKQEQIEILKNANTTLQAEKQNLENKQNQLQGEKQDLEAKKSKLEDENRTLNIQIEELNKIVANQSNTSTITTSTPNTQSKIVYITKTGEKYHKSNCSYLWNSKIEINLSQAKSLGYTPCSRCY